jgi:hypothetical protein
MMVAFGVVGGGAAGEVQERTPTAARTQRAFLNTSRFDCRFTVLVARTLTGLEAKTCPWSPSRSRAFRGRPWSIEEHDARNAVVLALAILRSVCHFLR